MKTETELRDELIIKASNFREQAVASGKTMLVIHNLADFALPYAQRAEDSEAKWISVTERLPELPAFVIAYKKNGIVLGLYYNADKEFMYGEIDQTAQITHWMPLPAPPTTNTKTK